MVTNKIMETIPTGVALLEEVLVEQGLEVVCRLVHMQPGKCRRGRGIDFRPGMRSEAGKELTPGRG